MTTPNPNDPQINEAKPVRPIETAFANVRELEPETYPTCRICSAKLDYYGRCYACRDRK